MKRLAILACALAAASCAQQQEVARTQPGLWKDWRTMAVNQMMLIPMDNAIPEELRWAFINCAVDTTLVFYAPDELSRLDNHASGARFLTDTELAQIEQAMSARMGGKAGLQRGMQQACPETVEKAAAYKAS